MAVNSVGDGGADGVLVCQTGSKVGFYGTAPVVIRAAGSGAALVVTAIIATGATAYGYTTLTQATAVITLVNEIRATLVGLGLMVGS